MRVVVLGGGSSPERDVSLRSSTSVCDALKLAGFSVEFIDPINGWEQLDTVKSEDIVFPILHGGEGEDGTVQKMLEDRQVKFLGSSSKVSKICFDKGLTLEVLRSSHVPTADGESGITKETYMKHPLRTAPHVLKAQRAGSSIGTYIIKDAQAIDMKKVDEVFSVDNCAVIEELVEGIEITVPILDKDALPVVEIVPPDKGVFDYENKYNGKSKEYCPSVSLDALQQKQAQDLALRVHQALGCRHLSRVDIIVRTNGSMVVLEDNTLPGMTSQSLYPLSAKVAGYTMPSLMKKFVELVSQKA